MQQKIVIGEKTEKHRIIGVTMAAALAAVEAEYVKYVLHEINNKI